MSGAMTPLSTCLHGASRNNFIFLRFGRCVSPAILHTTENKLLEFENFSLWRHVRWCLLRRFSLTLRCYLLSKKEGLICRNRLSVSFCLSICNLQLLNLLLHFYEIQFRNLYKHFLWKLEFC